MPRRITRTLGVLTTASALLIVPTLIAAGDDLFETPVRIQAGGAFIDTDIGHAAPYLYDFDGDGVRDLLVGQFGEGKLRIYRNAGTETAPQYETETWFKADHEYGTVPTG